MSCGPPTEHPEDATTGSAVPGEGFEPPKAYAGRFTVCSLWPLGHPGKPGQDRGVEIIAPARMGDNLATSRSWDSYEGGRERDTGYWVSTTEYREQHRPDRRLFRPA